MENKFRIGDPVKGRCSIVIAKDSGDKQQIILVSGWNDVTPFVVWRFNREDGGFYSGDYCRELQSALDCFNERK